MLRKRRIGNLDNFIRDDFVLAYQTIGYSIEEFSIFYLAINLSY
jgi:hypothetical protein